MTIDEEDSSLVSIVDTVDQYEIDLTNTIPAIFTNKLFVALGPGGVRITFAEQQGDNILPAVRTAVIMQLEDAIALYKTLQGLLKEPEEDFEVIKQDLQED